MPGDKHQKPCQPDQPMVSYSLLAKQALIIHLNPGLCGAALQATDFGGRLMNVLRVKLCLFPGKAGGIEREDGIPGKRPKGTCDTERN